MRNIRPNNMEERKTEIGVNSRNSRRPPPSSVNTGGVTEIMAEGGELEFVKRIIHDSLQLKKRLRWYSCMLGKKCSLAPLKEELRKQGVPKVTHTEFCQGRTMRWALAWSFYDDVAVPSPPSKKRKLEKAQKPLAFTLPEAGVKELQASAGSCSSSVDSITALIEKTLTELRVLHKRVPCGQQEKSLLLTAVENTWIHGRQKRREQTRNAGDEDKTPADATTSDNGRPGTPSGNEHFLFKCLLNVIPEGRDVGIEMHWVEGQNKDLMNQLRTYLRNTLLKSVGKV
uniref:Methyltransferase 10 domain-containing protein n=1 Tax=Cyprinodon variegatus TaxID=28743 RepID=A0A3Q2DGQ5_CYPVA